MSTNKIYVIHSNSKIESLYTLFPLIVSKYSHLFKFLNKDSKEAKRAEGDCVVLVRVFKGDTALAGENQKKRAIIEDFKKRFNRVIMLDDGAGSDSLHFEYMDLVDLYYKGKVLKDKSHYLKPMYGRQIFTDYYYKKFNIIDEKEKLREVPDDPSVLDKLRVSWNLGWGIYPMPNVHAQRVAKAFSNLSMIKTLKPVFQYSYKQMVAKMNEPVRLSKKVQKVQARFSHNGLPNTIGYQRKILMEKCKGHEKVLSGKIDPKGYNKEIRDIAAVLSPFGWGEICFRDFEAIINGSVLLKPNTNHIDTWPNVYKNMETYVPIDWDGTNLIDTITDVFANGAKYSHIVNAAMELYRSSLLQMDEKVLAFVEEITGLENGYIDRKFKEEQMMMI